MSAAAELISRCFHARTEAHVFHLKTKSYAAHKALNDFYDGIIPLADAFAECYQGRHGIIRDYPDEYEISENALDMLKDLRAWIDVNRKQCGEQSELQNMIDTIQELISATVYKLGNLS